MNFPSSPVLRLPRNLKGRSLLECTLWSRERAQSCDLSGVAGVRAVVVGHTPLAQPAVLGNVFFIDTGGWMADQPCDCAFCLLDAETLLPVSGHQLSRVVADA